MAGWKLYTDSACTTEFGGTLELTHYTDLSDNPQDTVLYFADVDDDPDDNGIIKKEAAADPGVDPILISVTDADVGSGHEAGEVTLAATASDLDVNTAGASLDLGTTILSGLSNAQEVHLRVVNQVTSVGTSTELSVDIIATVESEV